MRREVNGTAISRVDNSTPLCTVCEQTEAFEDMLGVLMPKEDWIFTQMCKLLQRSDQ
jgi:hypothetical protein